MIKFPRLALATALLTAIAAIGSAQAADVIPVYFDGANEGYNDATPVAPVGGNPGTTKGQQRTIVAEFGAQIWGSILKSNVPIYVQAQFNPLGANVLGSAGAATSYRATGGLFPMDNTWYQVALAESLVGYNINTTVDIVSQFSSDYDFYYGLDGKTPAGKINFLDVVLHEYAHGLGFANLENEAAGTFSGGFQDIYSVFTYDNSVGKFWPQMTIAERITSALNYGNVVFTGARATAGAKALLGTRRDFRVTAPASVAGNYSFNTVPFGPAVTATNFNGTVVMGDDATIEPIVPVTQPVLGTTSDGCSPLTNAANMAGKIVMLDRGYCAVTIKVKNAQNAGAIGVLIANNAAVNPPPSFSGVDATLTIPTVVITQQTATSLKANLPAQVVFVVDPTKRQGADDLGRPRLFMPNPVQSGSSGSHYDSIAEPNLLMEPAINSSLKGYFDLDITPALLQDIGWQVNTGNAMIGSPDVADCDAGVPVASDSGLMFGATIQANHQLCLVSAKTRTQYTTCMTAAKDRMIAAGILTYIQGQQIMTCARRVTDRTRFPIAQ